jgi:serine/threonine-protein kinase
VAILTDIANTKDDLGRFDESMRDREAAIRLDPRNSRLLVGQARTLMRLRRTAEARAAAERAVALASTSLVAVSARHLTEAASGNLAGARQVISAAARDIPASRVLAYIANYWDMAWTLDSATAQQLLALGPDAFDDDRGAWGIVRAQQYYQRGDFIQARAWGDTAARYLEAQLRETPNDAQRHVIRGWALAFAGRGQEGMAESARGLALAGADTTAVWSIVNPYFMYVAARTALLVGDKGKAIELLGESMRLRYYVTPAWLRIDPTWNSVRDDPRFEKLLTAP